LDADAAMLDSRRNILLACALSALAGYVDGLGFLHLGGMFVSFMSGNSTRMGVDLARGQFDAAAEALGLIALFVAGAACGSLIVRSRSAFRQCWILLIEGTLLSGAGLCHMLGASNIAIDAIVAAMGLENAVFQIEGGGGLGLTYVTGALVKVGQHIAIALTGGARFGWVSNLLLWASLVAGSAVGALIYLQINLAAIWFASAFASVLSAILAIAEGRRIDTPAGLSDVTVMTADPNPPAACLIGWPAAHSRSPLIHHHWLHTLGIAGGYAIEAVPPEDLAAFIGDLASRGFVGANVTIPHKERVLELTEPDARARAIGAANTLWYEGGVLRATNTDVEGFINNLDASAPGWDRAEEALVLGSGGSARAVVFGLLERGVARIHVVNRTAARAQALADQFGERVQPAGWEAVAGLLPRAGLLVNTTSLGMAGQPPLDVEISALPPSAVVADLVYVPLDTQLLTSARTRGLACADGLGMLLHQAVRGFELWFGARPHVTAELRALVEADLTKA
jgi:shikimate dehydrogenase